MSDNTQPQKPRCKLIDMSAIAAKQIEWLWDTTVPLGCLTMFYGEGDNGKSLTVLDIAARGSFGDPMPGESHGVRSVLYYHHYK